MQRRTAILATALIEACGSLEAWRDEPPSSGNGDSYRRAHRRWTKHERVYEGFSLALEVWGTYKSPSFREAFVKHKARIYRLQPTEQEALRTSEMETARVADEFHVTTQSHKWKWGQLTGSASVWRITLIDEMGREHVPESVQRLDLSDAYIDEFFPDRTPFSRTYLVRFARPAPDHGKPSLPARQRITLAFTSPLGRAELSWRSRD